MSSSVGQSVTTSRDQHMGVCSSLLVHITIKQMKHVDVEIQFTEGILRGFNKARLQLKLPRATD